MYDILPNTTSTTYLNFPQSESANSGSYTYGNASTQAPTSQSRTYSDWTEFST